MNRIKCCLTTLAVGLSAIVYAGYDEAGGYVTLLVNENNNTALAKSSLTTAGNWSDGEKPHSGTNYYAQGICYYRPAKFEGDSLTVSGYMRLSGGTSTTLANVETYPVEIPDLRMLGQSLAIDSTSVSANRIAPYGSTTPTSFKGKMTISNAVDLVSGTITADGSNAGWTFMHMQLVGGEDTCLRIHPDGAGSPGNAGIAKYRTGTYMLGDTTDFFGTIRVWFNQTLFLGASGFPNAKGVTLDSRGYSFLSTWATAGTEIPVSKITATASSTLILPVSNRWTVASLDLAAGAKIDCSAIGNCTTDDGGIVVTNAFAMGGKVTLDFTGVSGISVSQARILSVPKAVKTLTRDDFEIVNGDFAEYTGLALEIQTVGDYCEVCFVKKGDLPTLPERFDASTGYVVLTNNDGKVASYASAGNWSDGRAPHAGTNYYQNGFNFQGNATASFGGDRLVQTKYWRIAGSATLTVNDWWVLPAGEAAYANNPNMITTEGASGGMQTINGTMTFFTTEARPFCFLGGWDDNKWKINATWIGSGAGVIFEGPTSRVPGQPHSSYSASILGDTSRYYGTVSVNTNYTLRLGANGLPHACLKVLTEYSKIASHEAGERTVPICQLYAQEAATVDISEGNVFDLGSIVARKSIAKDGAGTLAAGGTAEVTDGAALNVNAGALQPHSAGAFDGLAVSFAADTKLVIDVADVGAMLQTDKAVTATAVTLVIRGVSRSLASCTVPVARLKSASAQALYDAMTLARVPGFTAKLSLGAEDASGYRTISAELVRSGLVLTVR